MVELNMTIFVVNNMSSNPTTSKVALRLSKSALGIVSCYDVASYRSEFAVSLYLK